ncbi:MAG: class F sortase [Candidatus Microsaccharimonas sp.]
MAPEVPWQFTWANLSIPSINLNGAISQYTPEQLVGTVVYDSNGNQVSGGAVVPAEPGTIAWYTGIPDGILSATASQCVVLYGHSYLNGGAIFDNLPNMTADSTATISTGNGETLNYSFVDSFKIAKGSLASDPRLSVEVPGCLILITCHRDGDRDADGHAIENTVVRLQLVVPKPAKPLSKWAMDHLL